MTVDAPTSSRDPHPPAEAHGAGFWIGFVIGGAVVAYGVRGVLTAPAGIRPAALARWVIGADLLHDFLLVPVAIVVGALVLRITPAILRAPVRFGLVASGVVALIGWAPWRRYGATLVPDNHTVQPLDYTTAILTALAVIWGLAVIWALVSTFRRARSRVSD